MHMVYFDPIQCTAIDIMHNIGTAKHAFEVWLENDLLTKLPCLKKD